MANKDRNKRSARKARAEERARVEAAQAASGSAKPSSEKSSGPLSAVLKKDDKKEEKKAEKKPEKPSGVLGRLRAYLGDVRSEMRRVVWPSKDEVKSYSISVIAMLIVFGVILWLVDSGIVAALVGYTGLRG